MIWRSLLPDFVKQISVPKIKHLNSNQNESITFKAKSIETTMRARFLDDDAQSQFTALRAAVGQKYAIWPHARLCDFITQENAIENLSSAMLMEQSKAPFVLCDLETIAPCAVVRFEPAVTVKSFTPSGLRKQQADANQDEFFRRIGLPVVVIDNQSAIESQIDFVLGPDRQVAKTQAPRPHQGQLVVS